MTYEEIVRAWNSQADEHNQYDTLSDRERIEFALSMVGKQNIGEITDAMAFAFHSALTDSSTGQSDVDEIKTGLRAALCAEKPCSKHPDAPHGFDRTASHSLGRYVCNCEGWEPSA